MSKGRLFIGSALRSMDIDDLEHFNRNIKSYKPWDQEVKDAQGRRRFHGAFTGGFSAGYYNTVGTEEGWKPKEWQSSRDNRAGKYHQSVEDFMDEEDLQHVSVEAKQLLTTQAGPGSVPHPLASLIQNPHHANLGYKIMQSLGWRPGGSIGIPRAKANDDIGVEIRAWRREAAERMHACMAGILVWKADVGGVGHRGGRQVMMEELEKFKGGRQNKGATRGAFGTGALDEEEDHEEYDDELEDVDKELMDEAQVENPLEADTHNVTFIKAGHVELRKHDIPPPPGCPSWYVGRHTISEEEVLEIKRFKQRSVEQYHKYLATLAQPEFPKEDVAVVKPSLVQTPFDISKVIGRRAVQFVSAQSQAVSKIEMISSDPAKQQRFETYVHVMESQMPPSAVFEAEKSIPKDVAIAERNEFGKIYRDMKKGVEGPQASDGPALVKTRKRISNWRPNPTLCKRIGSPDPYYSKQFQESTQEIVPSRRAAEPVKLTALEPDLKIHEKQPMDLFEAIFGDSEEDE